MCNYLCDKYSYCHWILSLVDACNNCMNNMSVLFFAKQKILYSASNTISKLRDLIIRKRNEVEHLRRQMKLVMILRNQVLFYLMFSSCVLFI